MLCRRCNRPVALWAASDICRICEIQEGMERSNKENRKTEEKRHSV